jgi:hypothetical protein
MEAKNSELNFDISQRNKFFLAENFSIKRYGQYPIRPLRAKVTLNIYFSINDVEFCGGEDG